MKGYFYVVVAIAILSLVATSCLPFIATEPPQANEPPVAYIDSISPSEAEVGEIE